MTVDDLLAREAIRHTLSSYNIAGDRLKAEDFVAVFTDDAVFESGSFRCEGIEDIRRWIANWGKPVEGASGPPANTERPRFVRHHLATSLIELTGPETGKGRTYWTVFTQIGADHGGYYLDEFRKTGERWLIAQRRVRVDWHAPNGLFRSPPAED